MTATLLPRLSTAVRSLAVAGLICAALAPNARAQKEKDTVFLRNGKSETGQVDDIDYGGVALEVKAGAKKTVAWGEVASVTYVDGTDLTAALASLSGGKLAEAIEQLDGVLKADKLRSPIKQEALYNLAVALQKNGDAEGALARYRESVESFPKGRYVRPAADHVVFALARSKDFAGANAFLDALAKGAKGLAGFEAEVAVLRGRVLESQGKDKADTALAQYDAAAKVEGAGPRAQAEVQLGRGRALLLQGKKVDAETIFRKLSTEDHPGAVLSGAWNGIGDILAEEGFNKKNSEPIFDALYSYLRGVVQYRPLDGEPTLEYEHALFGSSNCFNYISQLAQNAEQKKLYAERAREKMEQLRREFPSSPYLKN